MALTSIGWISLLLNLVLLALLAWLLYEFIKQQKRVKKLVNELGSDSLEHYLNEIKKRGFEFTLKPKEKGKKSN